MAKIIVRDTDTLDNLPFVNVAILTGPNAGSGFATNLNGEAIFNGDELEGQTIRASYVGYTPQTWVYSKSGTVPDDLEVTVVYLRPHTTELNEAEIETKGRFNWWLFLAAVVLAGVLRKPNEARK
jgi:hypothetical protein